MIELFIRVLPAAHQGQKTLAQQRQSWREFVSAVGRITGVEHA